MGRKSVVHSYNMFDGQATPSMDTSLTSNITNVEQIDKISIHCSWVAGPEGTFTVQARNGSKDAWYDLAFSPSPLIVAADDSAQFLFLECPFTDIRLLWVPTNAVASELTAKYTSKVVGS